jgi:RND superfamily putative drug exporter
MSHPQSAAHYEPPPADLTPSRAGVVSSAAPIMVAVFSIFIGMEHVELKMLGIGLAAAILLDATIVRGVLLPAMTLLGDPLLVPARPRPHSPRHTRKQAPRRDALSQRRE